MTGPEHFRLAADTMAEYEVIVDQGGDPGDMLAAATVHALLAQTAAFAMSQPVAGMPDEQGLDQGDFDDWYAAVNGLPPETREPVEEYPGELEHLRALLASVGKAADGDDAMNDLLIDHYSDSRIVDPQLNPGGAAR
jgi:hypothetical protein